MPSILYIIFSEQNFKILARKVEILFVRKFVMLSLYILYSSNKKYKLLATNIKKFIFAKYF